MKVSRSLFAGIGLIVLLLLGWMFMAGGEDPLNTQDLDKAPSQAILKQEIPGGVEVVAALEQTTVHGMRIPSTRWPSFVKRMERSKRGRLRQAQLQLAGRPFRVILGDNPQHTFHLYDQERTYDPSWYGSQALNSYHPVDDTFYEFRLVENGKKVAARPYRGELGTLKLTAGRRTVDEVHFEGAVQQAGGGLAPIKVFGEPLPRLVDECRIPVGNYAVYSLTVIYDNLRFSVSRYYDFDVRGEAGFIENSHALEVTRDRPCVLDFRNDPRVVFNQPAADQRVFFPGEEIKFSAMLVDPNLDIMVRNLYLISAPERKPNFPRVYWNRERLDPKVVIARANGEIVAEGVMPFG